MSIRSILPLIERFGLATVDEADIATIQIGRDCDHLEFRKRDEVEKFPKSYGRMSRSR